MILLNGMMFLLTFQVATLVILSSVISFKYILLKVLCTAIPTCDNILAKLLYLNVFDVLHVNPVWTHNRFLHVYTAMWLVYVSCVYSSQ